MKIIHKTVSLLFLILIFHVSWTAAAKVESEEQIGYFILSSDDGLLGEPVEIHYYMGNAFKPKSRVVIVMPGGGRNGDDYRDAWIDAANKYSLLILAPSFSEANYPGPLNYNLGRMIESVDVRTLADMVLRPNSGEWLFGDIDRLFEIAIKRFGSTQTHYDFFGHSAGGQIGHRLTIFNPDNKARTILAANSGWYTTTDTDIAFPFGLKAGPLKEIDLESVYSQNLVVLLGELDNADETRGHLRTGKEVNLQGAHRLSRGQHFFKTEKQKAESLSITFNWRLKVIPGVGHSYHEMSNAAADFLYQ